MLNNKNIFLDYFDLQVKNYCAKNPEYVFFRFGTSVYSPQLSFHDIDILIVKLTSTKTYKNEIDNLKNNFSNEEFAKNSFNTFDGKVDMFFRELKFNIQAKYKVNIQYSFSLGPLETSDKNIIPFHLAGPMSIGDFNYFFNTFPLFYTVLSQHNIKLSKYPFSQIFTKQKVSKINYHNAIISILNRAINCKIREVKLKSLKRIELIKQCYNNEPKAYFIAQNYYENIKNKNIDKLLKETIANIKYT